SATWDILNFCTAMSHSSYHVIVFALHLSTSALVLVISTILTLSLTIPTPRLRAAIAFIFFLGLLTMSAAVVAFPLSLKLATAEASGTYGLQEGVYIAAVAEVALGFYTCCLPSLRVVARGWL